MKGYVRRIEMFFGFHPHKYIPLHNQELISANVKAEATAFWIFMHSLLRISEERMCKLIVHPFTTQFHTFCIHNIWCLWVCLNFFFLSQGITMSVLTLYIHNVVISFVQVKLCNWQQTWTSPDRLLIQKVNKQKMSSFKKKAWRKKYCSLLMLVSIINMYE